MSDSNNCDNFKDLEDSELTLSEIIIKHYDKVWVNVYYLLHHSENDANDVTQEVFSYLFEQWDKIDKKYIGAWLQNVAGKKAYEFLRKQQKDRKFVKQIGPTFIENGVDAKCDTYFEIKEERFEEIKAEVLDMLNESERELYSAFFEKKMTYQDIMKHYSLSYTAATSRISRIRKKIEKNVKNRSDSLYSAEISGIVAMYLIQIIFGNR